MKLSKFTLFFVAIACSTTALAQIDCDTLSINTNGYVEYKDTEVFPNPAKVTQIKLSLAKKPSKLNLCGVTLTSSPGSYSIQAKDTGSLMQAFGGYSMGWTFDLINARLIGSTWKYTKAATLKMETPNMLHEDVKIYGYFDGDLSSKSVMAARIDGGKLQPLLFDNQFREVHVNPKMVKKIEIFIQTTNPIVWKRMIYDVPASRMTFFTSSTFPTK